MTACPSRRTETVSLSKRNSLGSRTAWLRPVQNTFAVFLARMPPPDAYQRYLSSRRGSTAVLPDMPGVGPDQVSPPTPARPRIQLDPEDSLQRLSAEGSRLEGGHLVQEAERLCRRPGQRAEQLAAVGQLLGQHALPRGSLHGLKQREERALVGCEIAQGLTERPVLRLRRARQPRGVGGEEGEGPRLVGLVLGEGEADYAHHVPGGVPLLDPLLERRLFQLAA